MNENDKINLKERNFEKLLAEPFEPQDLEWRVMRSGISGGGRPWVCVTPYITSRAAQNRLDEVFGVMGWSSNFRMFSNNSGYICSITADFGNNTVTKEDGAEFIKKDKLDIDPVKTAISNAFKRTAVQFRIGRYLYNIEEIFAKTTIVESRAKALHNFIVIKQKTNGGKEKKIMAQWETPTLPNWALPSIKKTEELISEIEKSKTLDELKCAFKNAQVFANSFGNTQWLIDEVVPLKDSIKEELLEREEELRKKIDNEIGEYIESLIKKLEKSPNESVFNQFCKNANNELQIFLLEKGVVGDEMKKTIENFKSKIKEVKNDSKNA